ncbi:MAG TPA: MFS transporter [Bryobacteraceae bacterium]|nr:MFS transporter [Bryobacteraceae bacterium]
MNPGRLFLASCLAIVTTSMVFSIRGDILDALSADFHLNKAQTGLILSPAFWGFTLSILIGGSLVDFFGMRRLLAVSSWGYILGIAAILFAPRPSVAVDAFYTDPGFIFLYAGMLILGLSQGLVEGVVNPLIATLFPRDKTHKLNLLHAWWPGGLIAGGLLAFAITKIMGLDGQGVSASIATLGWQIKLATILVPAVAYLLAIKGQHFPATERVAAGITNREMLREAARPMFLLIWVCMWLTAATELGPDQWVSSLITQLTGMQGVLILVYTAGLMFVLRFFGGPMAHRFSPFGLLAISAILAAAGLYLLGAVKTPAEAFLAATLFGVGKTYFWPTMLGITSELFPRGGALLLAIMGGTGNLATAFILPIMGGWYDTAGPAAAFRYVAVMPCIIALVFGVLTLYFRSQGGYQAVKLTEAKAVAAD